MRQIKRAAIAAIVCYLFIVPAFGCLGVMIVRNRSCHTILLALWGILLFFCLSIPLMAVGSSYLALDNVSTETFREACSKDMDQIKDDYGKMTTALLGSAKRFDLWSE